MARYGPMAFWTLGVLGGCAFTGVGALAAWALAGEPEAARALQGGAIGTTAGACVGAVMSLARAVGRRAIPSAAADTVRATGSMARLRFAACAAVVLVGTFAVATGRAVSAGARPGDAVGVGAFICGSAILFGCAAWAVARVVGPPAGHAEPGAAADTAAR